MFNFWLVLRISAEGETDRENDESTVALHTSSHLSL